MNVHMRALFETSLSRDPGIERPERGSEPPAGVRPALPLGKDGRGDRLSRDQQHNSVTVGRVTSIAKLTMSSKFAKYVRTRFGRRKKQREPQVRNSCPSQKACTSRCDNLIRLKYIMSGFDT